MQLDLTIPKPFAPLIDPNIRKIVEDSGRSSGKSTTNETVAVLKMLERPRNHIWYCRAEKGDIRGSIYNSLISTIQGMNLEDYFEWSLSPLSVRCRRTGSQVYFWGVNGKTADDLNATKGFTPEDKSLAMFILDEANEVKHPNHVKAAETTANKFLNPGGKIVYAYNPPPVMKHWSHIYFGGMLQRKEATRIYSTWQDIKPLLKDATIEEILQMKENAPKHYEYWYLGHCISLEGLVLYTYKPERNLLSVPALHEQMARNPSYQPLYVIYGVDSGVVRDPTAVCAWGIFPDGNMIKLSTFYHVPGEDPIPNSQQVDLIYDWYRNLQYKMAQLGIILPGALNEAWVFDSAVVTQDLMFEWQRKTMFLCKAVEKKSIERDIKRLQNGYFNGFLKILDIEDNEPSLEEIQSFSYDENNEIPDGQADHTIDADKYATAHYYYQYMQGVM